MQIKRYEDKYKKSLISIFKETLDKDEIINDDLYDINENYINKGGEFFLAIKNNEVVGALGYILNDDNTCTLHKLYIKDNMKHKGIGSKLYKKVEDSIINKEIDAINVNLDNSASKCYYNFYTKNGFTIENNKAYKKLTLSKEVNDKVQALLKKCKPIYITTITTSIVTLLYDTFRSFKIFEDEIFDMIFCGIVVLLIIFIFVKGIPLIKEIKSIKNDIKNDK